MRHGPMPISTFDRLVSKYLRSCHNGYRFYTNQREGERQGAAPSTTTLVIGALEDGNWLNIPVPDLPERTEWFGWHEEAEDGKRYHRHRHYGWRILLSNLVGDRTLELGPEIEEWLGYETCEKLRTQLGRQRVERF